MSRDFEYEIKDAVGDLADEGRSVNLAAAAIRDGRHIVRRRRAVTAAATFAVLAILVVPFALNRPANRVFQPGAAAAPATSALAPQTSVPVPSAAVPMPTVIDPVPGLVALPDGMVYASIPRTDGYSLVYNRSTGQYVRLPFNRIVPSPNGATAAVNDGKRIGLVDLDSGSVRWGTGATPTGTAFDWSPDGTQLTYLATGHKSGTVRVSVLRVAKAVGIEIGGDIVCPQDCVPAWLPDGQSIAVSGMDGKLPIRLLDPTSGNTQKGLERVTGILANGHGVSDDGALAVTQLGSDADVTVTATGETVLQLPVDAAQVYWSSGHELMVVRPDGVVVYSLDGGSVGTYPLPPGTLATTGSLPTLMRG